MMTPADPITDYDLDAFVDDQLPLARRAEVAAHLAGDPAAAARVMADLAQRDRLRLAFPVTDDHLPRAMVDAADILGHSLSTRHAGGGRLRRFAAVFVIGALGFALHGLVGPFGASDSIASVPPPAYVEVAREAHRTAMLRAATHHGPAAPFDAEEIRAATAIALPVPAGDWPVRDVQIFPSTYGPSVEMTFEAGGLGTLSLFAVRPGSFTVTPVTVLDAGADGTAGAYWQLGEVAYALTGMGDPQELARIAATMAETSF
ncbi:MAG: hypothetical protein PHS60_04410 [Zavarzinia sp.]|nr:hypothetical protein [Zavarzinia sp.]